MSSAANVTFRIRGKFARCIDSGGVVRERAGESSACVISNTCKQIVTSVCLFWIFFSLWTSFLRVYFMFVQPKFVLELNCSDFVSNCNYCMLLAKWSPSNMLSFILYRRWFTVRRRPFRYPGYSSGNTAPHEVSRARKFGIVWCAMLSSNYAGA